VSGYETDEENNTQPFNPIATNGEPFPWLEKMLPTSARPLRYMVTIHPNLTTLDVKGEYDKSNYIFLNFVSFYFVKYNDLLKTDSSMSW